MRKHFALGDSDEDLETQSWVGVGISLVYIVGILFPANVWKKIIEPTLARTLRELHQLRELIYAQIDKVADRFHNRLPDIEGPDIES